MITTTPTAIIQKIVSVVEAVIPLVQPARRFRLNRAPNRVLKTWANEAGANILLRLFEVRRGGARGDPAINDPGTTLATVPLVVTVVYPAVPKLYGLQEEGDLEALAESDAHQIRDALHAPTALVAGHNGNLDLTVETLLQAEAMWFQDITMKAIFYIEQRR